MLKLLLILQKPLLSSMHPLSFLPFFLFVFLLYKYFFSATTRKLINPPPSPPKLPILGHLHKLGLHPHRSLQALSKQYGSLMLLHLGSKPAVIVSSASAAREILKTHDTVLFNRPYSRVYDKMSYNYRDLAFAPYGEYWKQMRSIFVSQLLSNKRVRSYRCIREEETALLIENIRNSTKEVNLSDMFTTLTNGVICRVAFGRKYSSEDQKGTNVDFRDVLRESVELLGAFNIGDFIPWMGWISWFNGLNERRDKAFSKFDMLIEEIVSEHSDRAIKQENRDQTADFVDVLLEVQREKLLGCTMERESIKGLIADSFSAGTTTTTAMLEWAMSELLRNPTVMHKLQKEIREIIRDEEVITEEALENMKYLKAVITETLRLHPPVPLLIPRESTQNLKINGYDIASKTWVIVNVWAIHRDPILLGTNLTCSDLRGS